MHKVLNKYKKLIVETRRVGIGAGSDTAQTQQTVINQKRTNKNGRRGENVIIFIIARQGGKLGAFREFFPSYSFLTPRRLWLWYIGPWIRDVSRHLLASLWIRNCDSLTSLLPGSSTLLCLKLDEKFGWMLFIKRSYYYVTQKVFCYLLYSYKARVVINLYQQNGTLEV